MNSKQYVIFLLCLLLLSMVWSLYSGEREKELSFYRVRIDHDRIIIIPPDDEHASPPDDQAYDDDYSDHADDDHEPEGQSHQEPTRDQQEYHDEPEHSHENSSAIVAAESIKVTSYRTQSGSFLRSVVINTGAATATAFAGVGATLFVLDRVVEYRVINRVLAQYHKSLATISAHDAQLMRMAYRIDDAGLRTHIKQMIMVRGARALFARKRSWIIPAITQLYYDAEPTHERIVELVKLMQLPQ